MPPLDFRPATGADAECLARAVIDGFEGYRSFAPPGWTPPSLPNEIELTRALLAEEHAWSLLAEGDGQLAGHITFLPAARAFRAVDDPALAHLRNLFVSRDHWGSGLATALHEAGVAEASTRGFAEMRLFTPAGQARARRFYEREGWAPAGDEFHDDGVDLVIVEYRRPLHDRRS